MDTVPCECVSRFNFAVKTTKFSYLTCPTILHRSTESRTLLTDISSFQQSHNQHDFVDRCPTLLTPTLRRLLEDLPSKIDLLQLLLPVPGIPTLLRAIKLLQKDYPTMILKCWPLSMQPSHDLRLSNRKSTTAQPTSCEALLPAHPTLHQRSQVVRHFACLSQRR